MKVVFVLSAPTSYREPMLARLASTGLEIKILYCRSGDPGREWELGDLLDPLPHRVLPGWTMQLRREDPEGLSLNPSVWRSLDDERPEAVIVGGYFNPTMQLAMTWCRLRSVPYVLLSESQDLTPRSAWREVVKGPIVRAVVKHASAFLATGSAAREYLVRYGADRNRVGLLPNTPDIEAIGTAVDVLVPQRSHLRSRLDLAADPLFLFVGRLVAAKNLEVLLRAFAAARSELAGSGLVVAGDGPLRQHLGSLAERLSPGAVRFVGFVQPKDLPLWYALADVFCLPSRYEPWGVVLLEAMAAGRPVVASDRVGAAHDLLGDGQGGVVVPAMDVEAWRRELIRLGSDADLRRQLGESARQRVSSWDYRLCITEIQRVLEMATG